MVQHLSLRKLQRTQNLSLRSCSLSLRSAHAIHAPSLRVVSAGNTLLLWLWLWLKWVAARPILTEIALWFWLQWVVVRRRRRPQEGPRRKRGPSKTNE